MKTGSNTTDSSRTALIVSDDPGLVDEVGGWLETVGLHVIQCPGPRQNHELCVGLRTHRCPLAEGADLVVLDMHPSGNGLVDASARKDLPAVYKQAGRSVISLVEGADWVYQPGLDGTAVLNRLAGRGELLDAVADLMPAERVAKPIMSEGSLS